MGDANEFDYEELGLVAGLEIHQQLATESKLFCNCPVELREPEMADHVRERYLHPTPSELGEIDEAALEESQIDRRFEYLAYDSTCLVEEDEEPPGRLDEEALRTTLEIAALLDMDVLDQVHVMRKIVIDGSNTSGFQRTAMVATNGGIEVQSGSVGIADLMVEEESARKLEELSDGVRYSLDRLGIPLVEIGTEPDITTPTQAREAAERIGMFLRSTGSVRRGLGSIRQDVNVSIESGARVELKGVQRLDDIDDIIRNEVHRQVELLELAADLQDREAAIGTPQLVTAVFEDTNSGIIAESIDEGGDVYAVPLFGFDGLVGREIQPDRRLGTELSDHAQRHGVGGIFHTDELPAYGITADEVEELRGTVGANHQDAVAFVAAEEPNVRSAIEAVADRARTAIDGVPEETRGANEDCTSRYLRPLPGAARMYPETDVPPVEPTPIDVTPPELLTDKVDRYISALDLDPALAEQVAFGERWPLFEAAIERGVDPTLAATTLESTVTELRRDGVPVEELERRHFLEIFEMVTADELATEGIGDLLTALATTPELSASAAADREGLGAAEADEVRDAVVAVVERNEEQVTEEGMEAFSALMGDCMAELRGQADGDLVSSVLREEIKRRMG